MNRDANVTRLRWTALVLGLVVATAGTPQGGVPERLTSHRGGERGPVGASAGVDPAGSGVHAGVWLSPEQGSHDDHDREERGSEERGSDPAPGGDDSGNGGGSDPGDAGPDHDDGGGDGDGGGGFRPPAPGSVPPGGDDDLHLPDLRPFPAHDVFIGEADRAPSHAVDAALDQFGRPEEVHEGPALRFTTSIVNAGEHSFELAAVPGVPDPGDRDVLTVEAFQCVRFEGPEIEGAQRACVRHERVGTMTYHAHHRHFHIDGFALYQLRRDDDGRPMFGPGSVVAQSGKVGWCVSDMEPPEGYRSRLPVQLARWYGECAGFRAMPATFRMGISPGWTDIYWNGFTGQQIPIKDVPDGVYWITIRINPPENPYELAIRESDHTHNMSFTKVRIHNGGTEVEVLT